MQEASPKDGTMVVVCCGRGEKTVAVDERAACLEGYSPTDTIVPFFP